MQTERDAELLPACGEWPAETLLDRRHPVADGPFVQRRAVRPLTQPETVADDIREFLRSDGDADG